MYRQGVSMPLLFLPLIPITVKFITKVFISYKKTPILSFFQYQLTFYLFNTKESQPVVKVPVASIGLQHGVSKGVKDGRRPPALWVDHP
jgi:hypothetical protein